ncbi:MAG: hypothetical protein M1815_000135 [Lichina confinis]|nr:MAG: hypothetical protein M1815_000135 [Lichina confinis]
MGSGWVHNAPPEVNAISRYPTILAVCISLTAVMTAIIAVRGYVRAVMLKSIGADDWTILFSGICSIVYNALAIAQSRWGLGLPIALRPKENTNDYREINFAGRPFYMVGITGFKVALCLAYLRIVPPNKKRTFRPLIWLVLVACVLCHLAGILILVFQCLPVRKSLRPETPGKCLPDDKTFYGLAAITIFFDVVIFLLPIPLLLRVQITTPRKVALIGLFVLGLFTTVCSVLRMIQIIIISKNGNSTMLIILTCIPTLTPLFKLFRERATRLGYVGDTYESGGSSKTATENHTMDLLAGGKDRKRTSYRAHRDKSGLDPEGSSQESILGLDSCAKTDGLVIPPLSTATPPPPPQPQPASSQMGGIRQTTDVEVKISDALRNPASSSGGISSAGLTTTTTSGTPPPPPFGPGGHGGPGGVGVGVGAGHLPLHQHHYHHHHPPPP